MPTRTRRSNAVLPIVIHFCILSLVSYVSQIILHPVYGGVGTALHHYNVVFTIAAGTSLATFFGFDRLPPRNWKGVAVVLITAPLLLPTVFGFSGQWGPIWGPILTQAIMTWPCVFFASHDIAVLAKPKKISAIFLALTIATGFIIILGVSETRIFVPLLQPSIGILWSRFSLLLYLGIFALMMDRRDWVMLATIIPIALIVLNRPHVTTGVTLRLLARLPPDFTYINRRESIIGMVTVIENSDLGYRVLRCDHSLLGGLWVGMKRKEGLTEEEAVDQADSVYSAFVLQEAIRLVQRPRTQGRALIIGLGVGITAKSLHRFGVNVTAIEIDPVVHEFAQKYFGLPNLNVFHEDGRAFIEQSTEKWDYIIHDVFTGGSVPTHLFTVEMWGAVKERLSQDGVVVVNVVGSLDDTSPVISTLLSSFDYCRGFSDPLDTTDGPKNMAIFCSSSEITFRQPLDDDFQGSGMRQRVLTEFPNHEIQLTGDRVLTDKHSYLGVDTALDHWHVIRTVLPAEIWINY